MGSGSSLVPYSLRLFASKWAAWSRTKYFNPRSGILGLRVDWCSQSERSSPTSSDTSLRGQLPTRVANDTQVLSHVVRIFLASIAQQTDVVRPPRARRQSSIALLVAVFIKNYGLIRKSAGERVPQSSRFVIVYSTQTLQAHNYKTKVPSSAKSQVNRTLSPGAMYLCTVGPYAAAHNYSTTPRDAWPRSVPCPFR